MTMKTLEDEALEYVGINPDELVDLGDKRIKDAGHFIAGANSKWVQRQIIEAKIDGLSLASQDAMGIIYRIMELEDQLKGLEDESK